MCDYLCLTVYVCDYLCVIICVCDPLRLWKSIMDDREMVPWIAKLGASTTLISLE